MRYALRLVFAVMLILVALLLRVPAASGQGAGCSGTHCYPDLECTANHTCYMLFECLNGSCCFEPVGNSGSCSGSVGSCSETGEWGYCGVD